MGDGATRSPDRQGNRPVPTRFRHQGDVRASGIRPNRVDERRDGEPLAASRLRVNGVIIFPAIDETKGGRGIWDRADPDVITLEGLHESLGHAVAFRAFDRGEARHQVERQAISMVL